MAGLPRNSLPPESQPDFREGPTLTLVKRDSTQLSFWYAILISFLIHGGVLAAFLIVLLVLPFFGINLITFERPERVQDIEFQLVSAPDEKPRNPNTRNRAEHNTRAGGEKIPNVKEAQSMQKAGQSRPQPQAQSQASQQAPSQPTVQPQPKPKMARQPQPRKASTTPSITPPTPSQSTNTPAPPRPRVTAPRPSTSRRVASAPNPLAPIKVPDAPGPATDTGPLVKGPVGGNSPGTSGSGGSSGGGSAVGPATVPGQFSSGGGGGRKAGGGPSGQGGRGSYSQYGSPGGGGGRPGIDAVAEPDFGPYLAELQRRIRRNWTPPEDREDKTVVLMFTISKDGRLLNISTKRSSGYANADGAARSAVERSAPFRPLPAEYRNSSINVEFTFDYNVYTGRSGGISRR